MLGRALAVIVPLFLACVGAPALADPPIPALTGRVVDQANILGQATVSTITSQLAGYEARTGTQIVVVTLPALNGYSIEAWGLALGRGWGIGEKGKNDGVLLIVAPNDRRVRIEVGYGLEGKLPDAIANRIIQSAIIPPFKNGDLKGGVLAGVTGILQALDGSYRPPPPLQLERGSGQWRAPIVALICVGLTVLLIFVIGLRRKWDPVRRRFVWSWVLTDYQGDPNPPQRSWPSSSSSGTGLGLGSGFSRGFSSSSSSGGFSSHSSGFSGHGGSFGGGGASGRW